MTITFYYDAAPMTRDDVFGRLQVSPKEKLHDARRAHLAVPVGTVDADQLSHAVDLVQAENRPGELVGILGQYRDRGENLEVLYIASDSDDYQSDSLFIGLRQVLTGLLRSLRRFLRSPFVSRALVQQVRDYNRPDFHPDDRDTGELVSRWREELFGKAAGGAASAPWSPTPRTCSRPT